MALPLVVLGTLLAGFAGDVQAETIAEAKIGNVTIAYDADRFRIAPGGVGQLKAGCVDAGRCGPEIGIAADTTSCSEHVRQIPNGELTGPRMRKTTSVAIAGRSFLLTTVDNGCRNAVPPSRYACSQVGTTAVTFSQAVSGCRHGPVAKPDLVQFLSTIQLRSVE